MVHLSYSTIPAYLQDSVLYRSLNTEDGDGELHISAQCYKADDLVTTVDELIHMLYVDKYWGLDSLPESAIEFCYDLDTYSWESIDQHDDLPSLSQLKTIFLSKNPLFESFKSGNRNDVAEFLIPMGSENNWYTKEACLVAVKAGNLECLTLLHEHSYPWDEKTCALAAECGHIHCLKYLHENGCRWDQHTIVNAASKGHLSCVMYAHQQGLDWSVKVCTYSAANGHLHCLQYARDHGCPWDRHTLIESARNGHLSCVQYAHDQGLLWHTAVTSAAASNGQLTCLQYAHENGCPWNDQVTLEAASGRLDCLRYALQHNCPISELATTVAARGHVECLQLLGKYDAQWSVRAPSNAAEGGHMDCLQFLHEHGCPWDDITTTAAAANGHLQCLRYAVEKRCAYTTDALVQAATTGHVDCIRYLIEERGMLLPENGCVFARALVCGRLECVKYFLSVNCPLGVLQQGVHCHPSVDYALLFRDHLRDSMTSDADCLRCIQVAREHGWRWDDKFVHFIEAHRHFFPHCCSYVESDSGL